MTSLPTPIASQIEELASGEGKRWEREKGKGWHCHCLEVTTVVECEQEGGE